MKMKALVTEREGLVTLLRIMKSHQEARQVRSLTFATPMYDPSVSVMAAVKTEISKVEKELKTIEPDVQKLLQSIPGIGPICAAALVAYIGDIHRFRLRKRSWPTSV